MSQLLEAELNFNRFTYGDMASKRRQMAGGGGQDGMSALLFYRFHPKIRGVKTRRSLRFITALIAFAQVFERLHGRSYGCHPANRPGGDGAIQVKYQVSV